MITPKQLATTQHCMWVPSATCASLCFCNEWKIYGIL